MYKNWCRSRKKMLIRGAPKSNNMKRKMLNWINNKRALTKKSTLARPIS